MVPYDDADLAALAVARGLVAREALPGSVASAWRGELAGELCERGHLAPRDLRALVAALQEHARECVRCGARFCSLPAPRRRDLSCPRCQQRYFVAAWREGIPPLAPIAGSQRGGVGATHADPRAVSRSRHRPATARVRRPTALDALGGTRRDPLERTERSAPSSPGRASRLQPSWQRDSLGRAGPQAVPEPRPGERVGPYRVEEEISRGAMGIVLRARHHELSERLVALKVMQNQVADEEGLARFQREGQALARLDHPNVVRVHELGVTPDGRPFIAMDFVEGQTLEGLAPQDQGLPLDRAAALLGQVARGVAHMHERGVVHRDLKLANVLLDRGGVPVIADFGLVFLVDRGTRLTQDGDLLGTPLYMAPEQIRGAPIDGRADVYALGVMLYRLVSGRFPFYATSATELFEAILERPVPPLPAASPDLSALLARTLAKDPTDRYSGAAELAADLEALAAGEPVSVRPLDRLERLRAWRRQHPVLAALPLVACIVLALIVVTGFALRARARAAMRTELEAAAETLEALRPQLLRGRRTREQTLRRLDEGLERARALLARAETLGDAGEATRARLAGVVEELEGLRARRLILQRQSQLEADARLGVEDLRLLLSLYARVPRPNTLQDEADRTFEEERARVLAACERLEAAAAALVAALPVPPGPETDWERDAAARRARRLAAIACRLGRFDEAARWLRHAPVWMQAELALARAVAEPEALAPALEPLEELLGADASPRAELVRVRAEFERQREVGDAPLFALLPRVRALADPPSPREVPRALQAEASLVEGELLLTLDWPESAAAAFARADRLLTPETLSPYPLALHEGGPRRLLAAELVALLGEARACARTLGGDGARAAAERAQARARLAGPEAAFCAGILQAEALELAEQSEAAERLRAELPVPAAGEVLAAASAERRARRAGERDPAGGVPDPGAELRTRRYLAAGEAELAAHAGARWLELPGEVARARLPLARRAFLLAASASDVAAARVRLGLARVALAAGDPERAEEELTRAEARGAAGWRLEQVRGLCHAARERLPEAAGAFLAAFSAAGAEEGPRRMERIATQLFLLDEGLRALSHAGTDPSRLRLLDWRLRLAEEVPLSPQLRAESARALATSGQALNDPQARARAAAARERAHAAVTRTRELTLLIRSIDERRSGKMTEPEAFAALRELWAVSPTSSGHYMDHHIRFSDERGLSFGSLTLGFELEPHRAVNSMSANFYRIGHTDARLTGVDVKALYESFRDETADGSGGPFQPSILLRHALSLLYVHLWKSSLPPDLELEALATAQRYGMTQPRAVSAALLEGLMRLELGDPAGAIPLLERARLLAPPFPEQGHRGLSRQTLDFSLARAHALLRRWEPAEGALRRAVQAGLSFELMITREPAFWEDRRDPTTLRKAFQVLAEQVRAVEMRERGHRFRDGERR